MSYTALYRKWRPKDFDGVVGQDAVARTLKNQILQTVSVYLNYLIKLFNF